jgi:crotonobetainyl-CoA:carnitine CoA-transferase CaiB-like acyl-CoA transferase
MGKPELAESPLYKDNPSRVSNRHALDALIADWARQFDAEALIALLNAADIRNGRAYTSADCAADPQYRFRNMPGRLWIRASIRRCCRRASPPFSRKARRRPLGGSRDRPAYP